MSKRRQKQNGEIERKGSEADLVETLEICLEEGWAPTRCPEGCRVEPDGVCQHGFESVVLEDGLI